MSSTLYNIMSIISITLTVATLCGGYAAFRSSLMHTANAVQERVITALQSEIDAVRARIDDLERENTRLRHTIETICAALKTRGIVVSIDGDMVNIRDGVGSTTARIQEKA
jgi:predicted  nucleic acid-binding Zn-ribbon protein